MTLGERIRKIRTEVAGGISQTEFAELLGIGRSELSNIEGDRLKNPEQKKPLFMLISSQFGVSMDWIINEAGPMKFQETDPDMEIVNDLLSDTPSPAAEIIRDIYNDLLKLNEAEQDIFLKFLKMRKGKE